MKPLYKRESDNKIGGIFLSRRWTTQEEIFVLNHAGERSLAWMGKQIDRTPKAVKEKLKKLDVTSMKVAGDRLSLYEIARAFEIESRVWLGWKSKYQFPIKSTTLLFGDQKRNARYRRARTHHIKREEFWSWANQHRELLDFNALGQLDLLPHPVWIKEAKEYQKKHPVVKRSFWRITEDKKIINWYKQGVTQKEMSTRLEKRTKNAVSRRIQRLKKEGMLA